MVLAGTGGANRERRRARLEQTALHLFEARGFDSVTVEQVCADAGLAPATFYRYFGGKEEVVFTYQRAFHAALAGAIDAAAAEPPPRQLQRVLVTFAESLQPMREEIGVRDAIVRGHPGLLRRTLGIQREVEDQLAEGLRRLRGAREPDARASTEAALGLVVVRTALRTWLTDPASNLPDEVRTALRSTRAVLDQLDL